MCLFLCQYLIVLNTMLLLVVVDVSRNGSMLRNISIGIQEIICGTRHKTRVGHMPGKCLNLIPTILF